MLVNIRIDFKIADVGSMENSYKKLDQLKVIISLNAIKFCWLRLTKDDSESKSYIF